MRRMDGGIFLRVPAACVSFRLGVTPVGDRGIVNVIVTLPGILESDL